MLAEFLFPAARQTQCGPMQTAGRGDAPAPLGHPAGGSAAALNSPVLQRGTEHLPGLNPGILIQPHMCLSMCLGTLTSITNLATSLARNMDRLSLDEEHYNRQEEWRRQLPESLGEGLRQGLSRLGISLLGKCC